jgi:hypothetical protein
VDLRPLPNGAAPLSTEAFRVLLSLLLGTEKLQAAQLTQAVDDVTLGTKVGVVSRFDTWAAEHPISGQCLLRWNVYVEILILCW